MPERYRTDRAEPARGHATAHPSNDRGGTDRAAAARKVHGLLSDEQKARLTALGNDQGQSKANDDTTGSLGQTCGAAPPGVMEWPTAEIDQTVRPTDARAQVWLPCKRHHPGGGFAQGLVRDQRSPYAIGRLAAVGKRLGTMLQAVRGSVGRSMISMEHCPTSRRRGSRRSVLSERPRLNRWRSRLRPQKLPGTVGGTFPTLNRSFGD